MAGDHTHEGEFSDLSAQIDNARHYAAERTDVLSARVDTLEKRLEDAERDMAAVLRRMRQLEETLSIPHDDEGQAVKLTARQLARLRGLPTGVCLRPGCKATIQKQRLGCRGDWYALPDSIRQALLAHYVVGQTLETATPGYLWHLQAALNWWKEHPGS